MSTSSAPLTAREVKQSLRSMMNGIVSQSMRSKGLNYKVIFGVELPRLQEFSKELPHTAELAAELWNEDIRECRLLAAMVQPVESFTPEQADEWVSQMRFPEEAECTVLSLFSRLPYASDRAFRWIAREEPLFQLCGYLILGRLFIRGAKPTERDREELLDQIQAALGSESRFVAQAAQKTLFRLEELMEEESTDS